MTLSTAGRAVRGEEMGHATFLILSDCSTGFSLGRNTSGKKIMTVPVHLRGYPCDDYFASEFANQGYWDEPSQLMLIVPASEVKVLSEVSFLVIGRPGIDGIEFGYRAGHTGLWAYYPIDQAFVLLAPTVANLVAAFESGKLIL